MSTQNLVAQWPFEDPRRRMLRFFSPLPKKAKQVPPSGLSPMVSARFPEPKPQERRRVVLAPAVSKKKKDKRGGANRGQGRKKGSLGQKRKREVGEETLSRKLAHFRITQWPT